jgi:putative transposase
MMMAVMTAQHDPTSTLTAPEAGHVMIKVLACGTSRRCLCGAEIPKRLHKRWHTCEAYGLSVPRDYAGAMVI